MYLSSKAVVAAGGPEGDDDSDGDGDDDDDDDDKLLR